MAKKAMKQASLPFIFEPDYRREKLYRGDFNAKTMAWLDAWPSRLNNVFLTWICGPTGSGKSHLLDIWATSYKATRITSECMKKNLPRDVAQQNQFFVFDDIDISRYETWFLDFINVLFEERKYLLVASVVPSSQYSVTLSDLSSRLKLFHTLFIDFPDIDAIENIIHKMLGDRAIKISARHIRFLAKRLDRSFDAIKNCCDNLYG